MIPVLSLNGVETTQHARVSLVVLEFLSKLKDNKNMKNTEFSRKLDQIFGKEQLHDEGFLDFVLKKTGNKQNLGRLKRSVLFYVDNIDSRVVFI